MQSKVLKISVLAGVTGLLFGLVWWLHRAPDVQLAGDLVHRVESKTKRVALTLDDGPSGTFTPLVLDTLERLGVRATFFLNGEQIEKQPQAARAIVAAGHDVGNHSYSHKRMLLRSQQWLAEEVESTDELIRASGYSGEIHFRPPYGKRLLTLPIYLARTNRLSVTWDVDGDPNPTTDTANDIVERVLREVRPGSIILLHVMWRQRQASRDALEPIILGLQSRGYEFVTLSELLD